MTEKEKRKKGHGGWLFLLGVAVAVIILLAVGQVPWNNTDDDGHVTGRQIGESIKQISELATLEYDYTYIGRFEDSRTIDFFIFDVDVPLTEKNFIGSFDGTIKYGINLEDIDRPKINDADKTIKINMPEIVKISHEIDFDSIYYWDKENNLFNPIIPEDSDKFENDNMKDAEKQAIDRGIVEKVQKHTTSVISTFIKKMYPKYKNYIVNCDYPNQKTINNSSEK